MSARHPVARHVVIASLIAASACTGGGKPPTRAIRGGTYRTAFVSVGFNLDPTVEYGNLTFGLLGQLLTRTLVTYRHVAGRRGNEVVPDLATDTGHVSSDGLTYTFHLKGGIKFGPPVNRAITSHDVEYAFRRIDTKAILAGYAFYYDGTIVGMDGPKESMPADIEGVETPDDRTVVFHLQQPTGDFLYRLALPAAGPIPSQVAGCFTQANEYGRDLVSSGPYMIRGANRVDRTSCRALEPMEGFDPTRRLILVRNPSYDPRTDDPSIRENNLDGVSIVQDANLADTFNKIDVGELDGSILEPPPPDVELRYLSDPALRKRIHIDTGDSLGYLSMNLLVPPFDDVHVRRAVNFAIDKQALQRAGGGAPGGAVATHVFPPTILAANASYDPYPSPGHTGDIEAAKDEMRQSTYDHDHDGVCDDPACRDVVMMSIDTPPFTTYLPTITNDLEPIGIDVKPRELEGGAAYAAVATPSKLVPMANFPSWTKDYADPSTFSVILHSTGINCEGQINYSEVGMTESQARTCGVLGAWRAVGGDSRSVDERIEHCQQLSGGARTACWVDLDRYVMEEVVPWVPLRWSNRLTIVSRRVTTFEFDQFAGVVSLCHIAVNNHVSPSSL